MKLRDVFLLCKLPRVAPGAFGVIAMFSTFLIPQAFADAVRVACVGDSITYGVAVSSPSKSYPSDLQSLLGSGYNVQNFGYPGLALMNLPQGNPSSHPAYITSSQYTSMVQFNPNIIIVMLGTNDAAFPVDSAGWSSDYLSTFTSQYESFISTLRNLPAKPIVYVVAITKVFGTNQYGIDPNVANNIIVPALHTIATASSAPLIDVYTATQNMASDFADNVHPDDAATATIATTVFNALQPNIAPCTADLLRPAPHDRLLHFFSSAG